jgi:hypothetical protein
VPIACTGQEQEGITQYHTMTISAHVPPSLLPDPSCPFQLFPMFQVRSPYLLPVDAPVVVGVETARFSSPTFGRGKRPPSCVPDGVGLGPSRPLEGWGGGVGEGGVGRAGLAPGEAIGLTACGRGGTCEGRGVCVVCGLWSL